MFTYISQGEPVAYGFLPAGVYEGKIVKMEEGTSNTGNPMLTVFIKAIGPEGTSTVRYYLPASDRSIWKIDLFVKHVIGKVYDEGSQVIINPADFLGRTCYVRLGVEHGTQRKKDGSYPQFNNCEEVLDPEEAKNMISLAGGKPIDLPKRPVGLPKNNHIPASAAGMMDDDIPF